MDHYEGKELTKKTHKNNNNNKKTQPTQITTLLLITLRHLNAHADRSGRRNLIVCMNKLSTF